VSAIIDQSGRYLDNDLLHAVVALLPVLISSHETGARVGNLVRNMHTGEANRRLPFWKPNPVLCEVHYCRM
jgi:hypothetical protein